VTGPACLVCGYPDARALRRWRPRQTKPWATILLCRKCHARAAARRRKAMDLAAIAAIQSRRRKASAGFTPAPAAPGQLLDQIGWRLVCKGLIAATDGSDIGDINA
jgi:hypothetical protein